jgi:hypothetical protein
LFIFIFGWPLVTKELSQFFWGDPWLPKQIPKKTPPTIGKFPPNFLNTWRFSMNLSNFHKRRHISEHGGPALAMKGNPPTFLFHCSSFLLWFSWLHRQEPPHPRVTVRHSYYVALPCYLRCWPVLHKSISYVINHPERNLRTRMVSWLLRLNHFQGCMEWIISGGAKDSIPAQKSKHSKSTCTLVRNFVNSNYPFCQDIDNPFSGNGQSRLNQANDKSSISVIDEGNNTLGTLNNAVTSQRIRKVVHDLKLLSIRLSKGRQLLGGAISRILQMSVDSWQ